MYFLELESMHGVSEQYGQRPSIEMNKAENVVRVLMRENSGQEFVYLLSGVTTPVVCTEARMLFLIII